MNSFSDNAPEWCINNPGDPRCYVAELAGSEERDEYNMGIQDWDYDQTGPQNWIAEAILKDAEQTGSIPGYLQHERFTRNRESLANVVVSTVADTQPVPASSLVTTESAPEIPVQQQLSWNGVTYTSTSQNTPNNQVQMSQTVTQSGSGLGLEEYMFHIIIILLCVVAGYVLYTSLGDTPSHHHMYYATPPLVHHYDHQ